MNILSIANNDPAGAAINFTNAINRYTNHRARLITLDANYGNFQRDLHIPDIRDLSEVEYLLTNTDILHLHMIVDDETMLGHLRIGDYVRDKIVVHHHHGEPQFRENPKQFEEKERELGRRAIVSTPDLLKLYPTATWVPNPVPIYDVNYLPYYHLNGVIMDKIVGHSPTRRELKNTDIFLTVVDELRKDGLAVRPIVIENMTHSECLKLKRCCDVFFDHIQGYFGVSSLEALSQGVPTIAGLDEWNIECVKRFTGADLLPWIIARDKDELANAIKRLVSDSEERKKVGGFSRRWMEEYWAEEKIANALIKFYEVF